VRYHGFSHIILHRNGPIRLGDNPDGPPAKPERQNGRALREAGGTLPNPARLVIFGAQALPGKDPADSVTQPNIFLLLSLAACGKRFGAKGRWNGEEGLGAIC
jgi:hypothetical protein